MSSICAATETAGRTKLGWLTAYAYGFLAYALFTSATANSFERH